MNFTTFIVEKLIKYKMIRTRSEFANFLKGFRESLLKDPESWENIRLSDFLEAMEAYTLDIQGYYDNIKLGIDADEATWDNFKQILLGASVYE